MQRDVPKHFDFRLTGKRVTVRTPTGALYYTVYPPGIAYISTVSTVPSERENGNAGRLLDAFLAAADRAGIPVEITAAPIGDNIAKAFGILAERQILAAVRRRGFKAKHPGDRLSLIRMPRDDRDGHDLERRA